jgi:uncharacterized protein YgbK (DUF1537 family)
VWARHTAGMQLLVAADDRTGALESAGALADGGIGTVPVHAWAIGPSDDAAAVVDLGTRHLDPAGAAALAASVDDVPAGRHTHKIDSTLRGNWAVELAARAAGRPVLVVAALPALGRTCRGGVVLVDGVPVHETASAADAGGRTVGTSRPGEILVAVGAARVHDLDGPDAAARWLTAPGGIAVCDAATDDDLEAIAAAWSAGPPRVLLAGTAAVIGAAGSHLLPPRAAAPPPPALRRPVLVVCGSNHPAAAAQVGRLAAAGIPIAATVDADAVERLATGSTLVLRAPEPVGAITPPSARAMSLRLAANVDELADAVDIGTLILIGGDTAAAVLGARTVDVGGTLAPGVPWGRLAGGGPLVVARSGGFGGPDALVDLLAAAH